MIPAEIATVDHHFNSLDRTFRCAETGLEGHNKWQFEEIQNIVWDRI